jgi:hypothetical protein
MRCEAAAAGCRGSWAHGPAATGPSDAGAVTHPRDSPWSLDYTGYTRSLCSVPGAHSPARRVAKGAGSTLYGVLLMGGYLTADGYTSTFQQKMFKGHKMSTYNQVLYTALCSIVLSSFGELGAAAARAPGGRLRRGPPRAAPPAVAGHAAAALSGGPGWCLGRVGRFRGRAPVRPGAVSITAVSSHRPTSAPPFAGPPPRPHHQRPGARDPPLPEEPPRGHPLHLLPLSRRQLRCGAVLRGAKGGHPWAPHLRLRRVATSPRDGWVLAACSGGAAASQTLVWVPPQHHPHLNPNPPFAGSLFISYTIKSFGALTFATIMTTRQFLSILLSSIFFRNPLTHGQWCVHGAVAGARRGHGAPGASPQPSRLSPHLGPALAPPARRHPLPRLGTFIVVTALYYQGLTREAKPPKEKDIKEGGGAPADSGGAASSGGARLPTSAPARG